MSNIKYHNDEKINKLIYDESYIWKRTIDPKDVEKEIKKQLKQLEEKANKENI